MKIGFIFIWTCLLTYYCVNGLCEEIQEKIVAYAKGKDFKELFQKYANKDGFIEVKGNLIEVHVQMELYLPKHLN